MMSGPLRAHNTATVCGSQYARVENQRVYCGAPGADGTQSSWRRGRDPAAARGARGRGFAGRRGGTGAGSATAADAAPGAPGAGAPAADGTDAGAVSEPMMLTGEIDEDDGNSYFDDTGTPDGAPGVPVSWKCEFPSS